MKSILIIILFATALQLSAQQETLTDTTGLVHTGPALNADSFRTSVDTITISPAHQQLLPELLKEQSELQRIMAELQKNINILLMAYVDLKKIQEGKVSAGPNNTIIVK